MGVGSLQHAPSAFSPVNSPDYHYTQGWLGPRAGLNRSGQQKISCPTEFRIRNRPALSESLIRLRYPRLQKRSKFQETILPSCSVIFRLANWIE